VIHKGVGQINESDIVLAEASDAIIIGFNVRPSLQASRLAENAGIQIRTYSIIYKAIEEVKSAMEGMLEPTIEEKITANVEIRQVFKFDKAVVAGCYVMEGKIKRDSKIRLIRDGIVIYPTQEGAVAELASLKRFKDDAKEVQAGMECGLTIKNYNDIKVGDVVEAYEQEEVKRTL
jgi:translation initiation factor IF-2